MTTAVRAQILRGNLAPEGSVAKITGKEGFQYSGPAAVFDRAPLLLCQSCSRLQLLVPSRRWRFARKNDTCVACQGPGELHACERRVPRALASSACARVQRRRACWRR